MNFLNQIFFVIFITSMTGTIAFGLWRLLQKIFFRWSLDMVYLTLRFVCLLYVMPVGYLWMQLTMRDGYLQADGPLQANFSLTGFMWIFFALLAAVWMILTAHGLFLRVREWFVRREITGGNIPEEDAVAEEEFERIRRKLHIRRRIGLCRNDMVTSPQICGILRPYVVLPYRDFTREELIVIFHHELTHYKSRDMLFKVCAIYVELTQHLNPFAGELYRLIDEWCEYHCDSRAVTALSDELDVAHYFEAIVESVRQKPQQQDGEYIFSMLCESQLQLERRIDYMKKYMGITKRAKACGVLLAFGFAMCSVTTTYAAGTQLSEAHDMLYQSMEATAQETALADTSEEIYLPAAEDNDGALWVYEDPTETDISTYSLDEGENAAISWTIPSGTRHISSIFHVDEGQSISIAVITNPDSCLCWIGIMDTWNNVRYVSGYSSLSHTFEITDSGSYRVFVQNKGKRTVTATGGYYYYTPTEETEETETEE